MSWQQRSYAAELYGGESASVWAAGGRPCKGSPEINAEPREGAPDLSGIAGVAEQARGLAERAQGLARGVESLASSTQDAQVRESLARTASRLDSSVVRPLADVLGARPDDGAASPPGGESELAHALHELAVDATHLRVRAAGAPALQEAVAALQDLACQAVANDAERLEARRTELAAILQGLTPTIQSAPTARTCSPTCRR